MRFFTTERLGAKQSMTPEGFLVCADAVLARTGLQLYGPAETPLDPGPDGLVRVDRTEDEVFADRTIASFAGKPVVNEHPEHYDQRVDVTTDNWRDFTVGWVLNPRRGTGIQDDLLIGDLMIVDRDAIDLIRSGKRELSCGYDADYEETERGRGKQVSIIGNHVALVDRGRCGPRCAIGDRAHDHNNEECCEMNVFDKVRQAFSRRDSTALDAALEELDKQTRRFTADKAMSDADLEERFKGLEGKIGDTADKVSDIGARVGRMYDKLMGDQPPWLKKEGEEGGEGGGFGGKKAPPFGGAADVGEGPNSESAGSTSGSSILNNLEMEAPPGTNDAARKARDSRYLEDSYQETLAIAEILVPGIEAPAFKVSDKPAKSFDAICKFRRKVLDEAMQDDATHGIVVDVAGEGFEPKRCSCADVRSVFRAAGAMKRAANNGQHRMGDEQIVGPGGGLGIKSNLKSIADINRAHREHYKSH